MILLPMTPMTYTESTCLLLLTGQKNLGLFFTPLKSKYCFYHNLPLLKIVRSLRANKEWWKSKKCHPWDLEFIHSYMFHFLRRIHKLKVKKLLMIVEKNMRIFHQIISALKNALSGWLPTAEFHFAEEDIRWFISTSSNENVTWSWE